MQFGKRLFTTPSIFNILGCHSQPIKSMQISSRFVAATCPISFIATYISVLGPTLPDPLNPSAIILIGMLSLVAAVVLKIGGAWLCDYVAFQTVASRGNFLLFVLLIVWRQADSQWSFAVVAVVAFGLCCANWGTYPVGIARMFGRRDFPAMLEEFCTVLCENYGGWRWSILSRFWRILGFWFLGCPSECHCQFGTDLALME